MKILMTLSVFLLFVFTSFSQELSCPRFLNPIDPQPENQFNQKGIDLVAPANESFVFNVKIHYVRDNDGKGVNFGKEQAQNAMMILNETYNKFKIYFKLAGFDYINNSTYKKVRSTNKNTNKNHPLIGDLVTYSKTGTDAPVFDKKALNIYVVDQINENPLTFGSATNGIGYLPGIISFFTYRTFLSTTLLHEIGHNFNLEHTYNLSGTSYCELVSGENAATAGDFVTDTPAAPLILPSSDYSSSTAYVNSMKLKDCAGVEFKNVLITNIMGHDNPCRDLGENYETGAVHFTNGQGSRMRNQIYSYISNTENKFGYHLAKTTLDKLYEPTEQVVVSSTDEVEISDDEENIGMANVCSKTEGISYEFQKGFKYSMMSEDGSVRIFNANETPKFTTKKSFNVNLYQINQLKSVFLKVNFNDEIKCEKQKYVSISVASTINFGNESIQFKQMTEEEIKTTNVFNSLPKQAFSIVTKETESGYRITKKIFKY
jgi:hypothetical protein